MALSCSKEASEKKEKKFMDLSLLPWDVLSLINGYLYSNNTQYLQDNRKDWMEKQDRNRVARQFDWMSAINSERFVEGKRVAILDRERNWMKLLAEWLLVSSDYLVPFSPFPKSFILLKIFHEFLQILNVCSECHPLFLEKHTCATIASASSTNSIVISNSNWIKVIHSYELYIQNYVHSI